MSSPSARAGAHPPWIKIMAGPIFFLAFGLIGYFYADGSIDPAPPGQLGAGFWPKMCIIGILMAAVLKAAELFRCIGKAEAEGGACKEMDTRKLVLMMLLIVVVVPAISFVGFPIATVLFIGSFLWLAGARKLWVLSLTSIIGTTFLIYIFVKVVYLPLPKGDFFFEDITLAIYRALFIM
ncbi:MAG: tripartite tricarboxylate transporter TctB family protein [Desulfobacterales bacterium]|jgi:putative tricarboxylic transport membrane protein|nr:tripartite tricarboxylate transporter TctB family protein [Desulfobacterales bacterium]